MLNKKPKTSKFAPKVDEGFLLGYGSNVHAYRVFNKTNGCVEIARDVTFDESNNSQEEQVVHENVDDDEAPCEAIRRMAIGDVRPQESRNANDHPPPPNQGDDHEQEPSDHHTSHDQEDEQDGGHSSPQVPHLRVHQSVQRDYPMEQILGDIEEGVITRS